MIFCICDLFSIEIVDYLHSSHTRSSLCLFLATCPSLLTDCSASSLVAFGHSAYGNLSHHLRCRTDGITLLLETLQGLLSDWVRRPCKVALPLCEVVFSPWFPLSLSSPSSQGLALIFHLPPHLCVVSSTPSFRLSREVLLTILIYPLFLLSITPFSVTLSFYIVCGAYFIPLDMI